jgi:hypothetical protein
MGSEDGDFVRQSIGMYAVTYAVSH